MTEGQFHRPHQAREVSEKGSFERTRELEETDNESNLRLDREESSLDTTLPSSAADSSMQLANHHDSPAGYVESELVVALPGKHFQAIELRGHRDIDRRASDEPEFDPLRIEIPHNPFDPGYPPPFKPIALYAKSDELWRGMIPVFPTVLLTHHVTKKAWVRFLEDIVLCSRIPFSPEKAGAYMALIVWGGYQWHKYMLKLQGRKRYAKVEARVELWNEEYFAPRKVRVLFQGPDDISAVRETQEEDFRAKKRSPWDFLRKNYTVVRAKDKARVVIMSL